MVRILVLLSALVLAMPSAACSCASPPLSTEVARSAKSVFVFKLLSAAIEPEVSGQAIPHSVKGKIAVVDNIRGFASFDTVEFSVNWCCGLRFDVGHYYAAFTSEAGTSFAANLGDTFYVGEGYSKSSDTRARIESVISGKAGFKQTELDENFARMAQIPPPPAPCPDK